MPEIRTPTENEKKAVLSTVAQLRQFYQRRHETIHYLRRMRFMRLRSQAPRPFQRVVQHGLQSPFSFILVQNIVGMLSRERPRFERPPRTMSQKEREAAARLQRSCDPLLQTFERIARRPLLTQFYDHLVADGEAVARLSHVPISFPMREADEDDASYNRRVSDWLYSGQFPLRMYVLDPLNVLRPMGDPDPLDYIVEVGTRPLVPTLKALGLRPRSDKSFEPDHDRVTGSPSFHWLELPPGLPPSIEVIEFWTPEACYVALGGQMFVYENPFGFIPYVCAGGLVTGIDDPELTNLSVLYPFQGIEPWLSTLLSTMAAWSILGGTPILWTSRQPYPGAPPPDAPAQISEIPLGKRIDLGVGGQIGFVQPPPVGREVLEFLNQLIGFLDRAGLSPITQGIIGTRTPGTAFNAAVEMALSRLTPIVSNAEFALAEIVKTVWRMVYETFQVPLVVTGIDFAQEGRFGPKRATSRYVIHPNDIGGYYDLHASLRISSLQDQVSRGMHAAFMRAHGLWTRERAMRFSDVEEPWEEFRQILAEKIEESPFMLQQVIQEYLQENPELQQRAAELQAQGLDIMSLLGLGGEPGATPEEGSVYGGAPQPRGGPAPRAGGRPRGSPKNPGGTRRGQGSRGPTYR